MTIEDLTEIMEIEHEAFTLPWTEEAFRNELTMNHFARYLVIELDDHIVGYAGMWTIMDEAHVTNIAIRETYRGRKLGQTLLLRLMDWAVELGMVRMTLEVRVTNDPAQRLYRKLGFTDAGVRKGYYSDNNEDALIMWCELPKQREYGNMEGSVDNS
ncbi:ribosomal protein S18-alanine N-acetyltransferase [Paenibacillus wulumuqiensis]|uniref:ribosomal protein S18-alanine N-acetyltransferase n=1 Tax=Paenibacillus wulumuqiensis TaxID=1567107 RepID=UPI0006192623|nr:ribosomal protein S18-alanine N-acetyltransferase [Paenibacillus wulumuqiensis]